MIARIIANLLIVGILGGLYFIVGRKREPAQPDLETPSPALGRAVATAVHQTLTDPYFAPLEHLADYLQRNPGVNRVTVDMLSKWAPDDDLPTCFVWDADGSRLQLDHAASPDAIEAVLSRIKEGLGVPNPRQLLYISTFRSDGEKFWLGFIRVPLGSSMPTQMAGAFFSMDRYIRSDVPRLLAGMLDRPRFPLVEFQRNDRPLAGEREGSLAIRILNKDKEVYFQRGRSFEPDKLIYSESRYFPKPVVALMEGWDLEVFSSKASAPETGPNRKLIALAFAVAAILISILIWWGVGSDSKNVKRPPFTSSTHSSIHLKEE